MLGLPQSTDVKRSLPKAQLYRRFDWKPSQRDSFDGDVARLDFVNWISPRTLPAIAEGAVVKEIYVVEVALKKRDFDSKNIALLAKSIPQYVVYLLRYEEEAMLAVYYVKLFTTDWKKVDDISFQLSGLNLDTVWENIVRQTGNITPNPVGLSDHVRTSLRDVSQRQLLDDVRTSFRDVSQSQLPDHVRTSFQDVSQSQLPDHVRTSFQDVDPQSKEIQHCGVEVPSGVKHPEGMSVHCPVESPDRVQHDEVVSLKAQIQANDERAKIQRQIELLERQMRAAKQPRRKRELFNEIKELKNIL